MRFHEFKDPKKEEVIVEILPVVGALAAVGRVGAQMGAKVAQGVGKVAGQAVKQGAKVGAKIVKGVAQGTAKAVKKGAEQVAQAVLKPGQTLSMPAQGGKEQEFKIDDVDGDEVTLHNPTPKDGEPASYTYNKKDLEPAIKAKADAIAGKCIIDKKGQVV